MDPVLLFFAGVAAFVIFRLISVMGTRTGHEQNHDLEAVQQAARARAAESLRDDAEEDEAPPKPVSTNARVLREAEGPAHRATSKVKALRGLDIQAAKRAGVEHPRALPADARVPTRDEDDLQRL